MKQIDLVFTTNQNNVKTCSAHLEGPMWYHGLYGSTSCCISHGPCQWERAIFDPPTAPRPLDRFSWNLKYITTSRTRPDPACKISRAYVDVGGLGK